MKQNKVNKVLLPDGTVNTIFISTVACAYHCLEKSGALQDIPCTQYGGVICALLIAATLAKYFGAYVFDEVRTASNRPHKHLYTRIRGVWYDFATFEHPGGPVAINLIKGRDGTALFESHHMITNLNMDKILAKYKVPDNVAKDLKTLDPKDDGAHYVWEGYHNDAFVKEANQIVRTHLGEIAKTQNITLYEAAKASRERLIMLGVLLAMFLVTLPPYLNGETWALFASPFMVWVWGVNYWHDALHFSFVNDWRINAFSPYLIPVFSSPWMWYHEHVIGHHAYTNIGHKDPDLAQGMALQRNHTSIKWLKQHGSQGTFQRFYVLWTVAVGVGLNLLCDFKTTSRSSYNNVVGFNKLSKPRMAAHLFGRAFYIWFVFVRPFMLYSPLKALIWATYPIASFSALFMVNSQMNHLIEECQDVSDTNFLKHQAITAQNFGVGSFFCFLMSGGLNYQIEHHLFPFLNHCHHPVLAPQIRDLCKKHGVAYNETAGYRDAFKKHMKHVVDMATKPVKAQ